MRGSYLSGSYLLKKFSPVACLLMLSSLLLGEIARVEAVTYTASATGDWNNVATWSGAGVPGAGDNILIGSLPISAGNFNITVPVVSEFGDGANQSEWVQTGGNRITINGGMTLTHNIGSTFVVAPHNNIWRMYGPGEFINNGTFVQRPRPNSSDTGRFNGSLNFTNNGIWEFQDTAGSGALRSNSLLVEGSGHNITVNSVGANPGVIRINMANDPDLVASIGFRQQETNTFTYLGDVGEVPFDIVAGHFLFGLPGRGDSFTYNGANFNGATAPLFTSFDRNVFEALFGSAVGDIPTGSLVGVGGAFDTINLVSANSGSTASPELHNYNGRIGIGDSAWQAEGNMMPTTTGGTLTITAATDADWYNGGFNTRGGVISNNGTLTARQGMTLSRDENVTGTTTGTFYIGQSGGASGEFRNEVGGTVRIEEGTLQIRDVDNYFRNFGTFELAGNGATLLGTDGSTGGFVHEVGGTLNINPGAGNFAAIAGDTSLKPFDNASGGTIGVTSGTLQFYPGQFQVNGVTQSTITAATLTSNFSVGGTESLEFMPVGADLIDIDSGALPSNMVAKAWGGLTPLDPNGTLVISEQSEIEWAGGHMSMANGTIINYGTINKTTTNGTQINSSNLQSNTFENRGQLNLLTGGSEIHLYQSTTFDNYGEVNMISNGGENFRPVNGGLSGVQHVNINNKEGGLFKVETDLDTQQNAIYYANAPNLAATPAHQLRNEGTFEVTRGIFRVYENNSTWSDFASATPTELIEGTYRVINTDVAANLDMSRLDLDIIDGVTEGTLDSYTGSLVSIASAASVVLASNAALTTTSGAQFPQLGVINNLAGSLYIHNAVNLPVDSALNVQSGATLGGSGTYDLQGGTLTLDDGSIFDPSALNGGGGTLTIDGGLVLNDTTQVSFALQTPGIVGGVNDLVIVNGDLTLDGNFDLTELSGYEPGTYRLFNYTGTLTDNGLFVGNPLYNVLDTSVLGQVNLTILPVPEPSTFLLLGLGTVILSHQSRRRRRLLRS